MTTTILIIDDDPTIRMMFARALLPLGEADQASNGQEALRFLSAKKYGVILLDLHMPVVDGFALLDALANKPGPNRDTPVYVISADTSDGTRIRALRRHAVFFLSKPVPIASLVSLVDSTLKKAAARALVPAAPARVTAPMGFPLSTPSRAPPSFPVSSEQPKTPPRSSSSAVSSRRNTPFAFTPIPEQPKLPPSWAPQTPNPLRTPSYPTIAPPTSPSPVLPPKKSGS